MFGPVGPLLVLRSSRLGESGLRTLDRDVGPLGPEYSSSSSLDEDVEPDGHQLPDTEFAGRALSVSPVTYRLHAPDEFGLRALERVVGPVGPLLVFRLARLGESGFRTLERVVGPLGLERYSSSSSRLELLLTLLVLPLLELGLTRLVLPLLPLLVLDVEPDDEGDDSVARVGELGFLTLERVVGPEGPLLTLVVFGFGGEGIVPSLFDVPIAAAATCFSLKTEASTFVSSTTTASSSPSSIKQLQPWQRHMPPGTGSLVNDCADACRV